MERRTGFAVAGAVAMILVAGAIAAGANMGLLGLGGGKTPVGKLRPTDVANVVPADQSPQVITVEVQDPARSATAQIVTGTSQDQPVEVVDVPVPSSSQSVSGETEDSSGPEQESEPSNDGQHSDD